MTLSRWAILGLLVLLGSCGRVTELKPATGQSLPVKPLMARATPSPDELLALPEYARPNRVDELVKRSQARQADKFDLPPPTGSAGPALPAGTDPQPISNETGPSNPQ